MLSQNSEGLGLLEEDPVFLYQVYDPLQWYVHFRVLLMIEMEHCLFGPADLAT
jgi:hypothetical protein